MKFMKTNLVSTIILFTFSLFTFLPHTAAEDVTEWGLPEGAEARLGKGTVREIAYSPDGTHLAAASSTGIWTYDAQTYLERSLTPLNTEEKGLWFSPDLRTRVSSKYDSHNNRSTINLWDWNTGELRHSLTEHTGKVGNVLYYPGSVVFSPDGQKLLIISVSDYTDPDIKLWDANSGKLLHTFTGHTGKLFRAVFSSDGQKLLIASWYYSNEPTHDINLWDVNSGEILHTFTGDMGGLDAVFSPDGQTLAISPHSSGNINLWHVETGTMQNTLMTDAFRVNDVVFSPDGQKLVSSDSDDNVLMWDVKTGTVRQRLTGNRYYYHGIRRFLLSPDGQALAGAGYNEVALWDLKTGELLQSLIGHEGWIYNVAFSPDGQTLASASSQDGTISFWDVNTGKIQQTITGHVNQGYCLSLSPDGQTLTSGGGRYIYLWDMNTRTLYQTFNAFTLNVRSIAFSPDGQTIASAGQDSSVWLLDANSGALLWELIGHAGNYGVNSVAFSPDGKTLASGGDDDTIRLWNVKAGTLHQTLTGHSGSVRTVLFSPDGQRLASQSDSEVYLWDIQTGTSRQIGAEDGAEAGAETSLSIAFSPDGETLASISRHRPTLRLWDANTGAHLRTLTGYTRTEGFAENAYLAFSPGGHTIASAGETAIQFWDLNTGEYHIGYTHSHRSRNMVFSLDGQTIASGHWDGTVMLWDLKPILGPSDESPNIVEANTPIRGPWLWMIAPTEPGQGGAASTDVDSLAVASGGAVTEADVAANGATEGEIVGDYAWILAELPEESNVNQGIGNINQMLVTAGVTESSHLDDFSSYALIVLESKTDHSNVTMRVGSDDSIKVWLNGSVVHTNAINRASLGFDDTFTVNLVAGDNLLLVKVSEWIGAWKMYVGIDVDVTVKVPMATPKPMYAAWDVNEDGQVNILDLVVVGQNIGETVAAVPRADVNGDNSIDILDLVLVAGHFGESTHATAPISVVKLGELDPALVEKWLALARIENDGSLVFQLGIANLERLLASLIPQKTALLANYPNPFNPETWIPYQLAKPADVTVTIYAADGKLLRTLDLGHQPVGSYQGKNRAAYWDGKNALGESVASGVYFYTLTAGDFSATRKMLILK